MHNIAGSTDAQREDISWVNTKAGTGAMWHTGNKVHISRNLRLKNLERDPVHTLPRWRGSHGAAVGKTKTDLGHAQRETAPLAKASPWRWWMPSSKCWVTMRCKGSLRPCKGASVAKSYDVRGVGVTTPRPWEPNGEVTGAVIYSVKHGHRQNEETVRRGDTV